MKKKSFALLFILLNLLMFQELFAAGALAIDEKKGSQYGWAVDYPTIELAEKRALEECGKNCYIVFTFSGGAAAYAADQSKGSSIWGWGRADSAERAKQIALEEAQSRGAKSPIIRVWGQESKKNESKKGESKNDDKVKVYVDFSLDVDNDKDIFAKGGWVRIIGWTYATKEELSEYGLRNIGMVYSDYVTGTDQIETSLVTPRNFHTPDNSPIMKRFVNNVVHKHPIYAKREVSEYHQDAMKMWSQGNFKFFGYSGTLIIIDDGGMTYEQLKNTRTYWEQKEGGYTILDVGAF